MSTDKNLAYIKINSIFSSTENEEKSNEWKLSEMHKVLSELQKDTYIRGVKRGFAESEKLIATRKVLVINDIEENY